MMEFYFRIQVLQRWAITIYDSIVMLMMFKDTIGNSLIPLFTLEEIEK